MSTFQKIIEYTLYLFVFLLPFGTRYFIEKGFVNGGYLEYKTISLYLSDIVLVFLLTFFLVHQFLKVKKSSSKHNISLIWWLISGLDLAVFISIFQSPDHILALYKYVVFLLGVGLFWVIIRINHSKTKLYFSLLIALVIQASIGIWQFLSQSDFASKWLGMAIHLPSQAGTSVVAVASQGERWLRAYGGMDHPNILGGALVIGILLTIWMLVAPKGQRTKDKIIHYVLLFVFTTAIFFTFSRSSWLSLFVGCFIILTLNYTKGEKRIARQVTKVLGVMAVLVVVLVVQFQNLVNTRLFTTSRLEVKSNVRRVELLQSSSHIIGQNFVFGTGVGNYSLALAKEKQDQPAWTYQPVHNSFLLVLSEIGFFGFIFFISVLVWIGLIVYKRKDYSGLSILFGLLILMMFEHWLWSLHFGILFLWLILGLVYKKPQVSS